MQAESMGLSKLIQKKKMNVVGIMSGTSLDGIDFVLIEASKKSSANIQVQYKDRVHVEFPEEMKFKLAQAARQELKVDQVSILHHDLGRYYASCMKDILKKKKWKVDVFGLHGQTVFHEPPKATSQIGEPSYLAALGRFPVVSDFRVGDLAVGGQGAPLASLFHQVAFSNSSSVKSKTSKNSSKREVFSLHNLGGISNLTLIDSQTGVLQSFDTGPANMLMDLYMKKISNHEQECDWNGQLAFQGIPNQKWIEHQMQQEYFQRKAPKSCGREQFGEEFLEKGLQQLGHVPKQDIMATLCELTARTIAESYKKLLIKKPTRLILCGGGALNPFLKNRIQYHLSGLSVQLADDYGWHPMSIEGAAFALLAAYRIWEIPANLPKTTGAKKHVLLGQITQLFA
jgi:anhydro-N-acetylmuramic acid kinase